MVTIIAALALAPQKSVGAEVRSVLTRPAIVAAAGTTAFLQIVDSQQLIRLDRYGKPAGAITADRKSILCGTMPTGTPLTFRPEDGVIAAAGRRMLKVAPNTELPVFDGLLLYTVEKRKVGGPLLLRARPIKGSEPLLVSELKFRDLFTGDGRGNVYIVRAEFRKTRLDKYVRTSAGWKRFYSRPLLSRSGTRLMAIAPGSQTLAHRSGKLLLISAPASLSKEEQEVAMDVGEHKSESKLHPIYRSLWEIDMGSGRTRCVATLRRRSPDEYIHDSFLKDEFGDRHRVAGLGNGSWLVAVFDKVYLVKPGG